MTPNTACLGKVDVTGFQTLIIAKRSWRPRRLMKCDVEISGSNIQERVGFGIQFAFDLKCLRIPRQPSRTRGLGEPTGGVRLWMPRKAKALLGDEPGGLTLKEALQRTWAKFDEHEIMTRGCDHVLTGVAALVPFLVLVIVLAAFLLPWITVGGELSTRRSCLARPYRPRPRRCWPVN